MAFGRINVGGINSFDSTAEPGDILDGKTAIVKGEKIEGTLELTGNAAVGDVLSSKTFYSNNAKSKQTGTMPNQGAKIITPSAANQAIVAGYHNGNGYVAGSANLTEGNIKEGVNIFGKIGTLKPGALSAIELVDFGTAYSKTYTTRETSITETVKELNYPTAKGIIISPNIDSTSFTSTFHASFKYNSSSYDAGFTALSLKGTNGSIQIMWSYTTSTITLFDYLFSFAAYRRPDGLWDAISVYYETGGGSSARLRKDMSPKQNLGDLQSIEARYYLGDSTGAASVYVGTTNQYTLIY